MAIHASLAVANEINMQDGIVVTSCSGTIYDHAGPNGSIQSYNSHKILTLRSAEPNKALQLVFEELRFGYSNAFNLKVYDGGNTQSPLLVEFTSGWDSSPYIGSGIMANSGEITLEFTSISVYPGYETGDGWKASWNCVEKSYNMQNGSITACGGALHDPGGPNGSNSDNGTYVFTINPESSGQAIAMDILFANLWTSDLTLYDGSSTNAPVIWSGTGINTDVSPKIARSGSLTAELVVSGSSAPNFLGVWQCIDQVGTAITNGNTTNCTGTLYDSGGLNGEYTNNEDRVYTISTNEPNTIIDFRLLEFASQHDYDTLWVYDGATVDPTQVLLTGSGYLNQSSILLSSSAEAMTFRFKSDWSGVEDGFVGNWTCRDTVSEWSISTGIEDRSHPENSSFVFPNPSNGHLNLTNTRSSMEDAEIRVFNAMGQIVYQTQIGHWTQGVSRPLDLSQLTDGVYLCEIRNNKKALQQKTVIKH